MRLVKMLVALVMLAMATEGREGGGGGEGGRQKQRRGLCLRRLIEWGEGSRKGRAMDVIVDKEREEAWIVGPLKPLWIVADADEEARGGQSWQITWGEGRDLAWIPREEVAASQCIFTSGQEDPKIEERIESMKAGKAKQQRDEREKDENRSFITFRPDPFGHVNLLSCPLPSWVKPELMAHRQVKLHLLLVPRPAFHALTCNASAGSDRSFCNTCERMMEEAGWGAGGECVDYERLMAGAVAVNDLLLCLPDELPRVTLSLCCMIRDEALYLREWIEYSRLMGVERFLLYDHGSRDNSMTLLAPYVAAGIVVVHDWNFSGYPQKEAHTHCTRRYAHQTEWLGLFDVDEFFLPRRSDSIIDLLRSSSVFGGDNVVFRLKAAMFGTSRHRSRPAGLVVDEYVMRSRGRNADQGKVLFPPRFIIMPGIHEVLLARSACLMVDVHPHDFRYNHYRSKSVEDHAQDPLRKEMAIEEADEEIDVELPLRFSELLHQRLCPPLALQSIRDEGGRSACERRGLFYEQHANVSWGTGGGRRSEAGEATMVGSTLLRKSIELEEQCPPFVAAIAELLDPRKQVIDWGCGSGFMAEELGRMGFRVRCVDSEGLASSLLPFLHTKTREAALQTSGGDQMVSFSGAEGALTEEQERKLLSEICQSRPSLLVLGWRLSCSPFQYGAKVFCRDGSGEDRDLDGKFVKDEEVEGVLRECGMLLSRSSSSRLWDILTEERRRVRPAWRRRMLEDEAGHFSTGLTWCDGTSSVMVFERLELSSLSLEASQAKPCSPPFSSLFLHSSKLLLAASHPQFSHSCVELVGLEGSSFVSSHPDGKMHFEVAVSRFLDVYFDEDGESLGSLSDQQDVCVLYRHAREDAPLEETLRFSCRKEVEIGWLRYGAHKLAAAAVSRQGHVLGGWMNVSFTVSDRELDSDVARARGGEEQEQDGRTDVGGGRGGGAICSLVEELADQHCYGMLSRQEETSEACRETSCQHWMFSPLHGCWVSELSNLLCLPSPEPHARWVGQRKRVCPSP